MPGGADFFLIPVPYSLIPVSFDSTCDSCDPRKRTMLSMEYGVRCRPV
jgi:hypothetical protein